MRINVHVYLIIRCIPRVLYHVKYIKLLIYISKSEDGQNFDDLK